MSALRSLLGPLRRVHFPVDDAATALSLAVRFVPVLGEELARVRNAQASRGARFDSGGLVARLQAWGRVLVPLFVGAFRRADRVAVAMDARCYGAAPCSAAWLCILHAFFASSFACLSSFAAWCRGLVLPPFRTLSAFARLLLSRSVEPASRQRACTSPTRCGVRASERLL